ncbi:MAG: Xaa-Pro aminopeptidase [Pirellulaceae bacterium]|nr:MAG: Xaa-Pro aminopeptidase [Pirellulaceae bacterium]
MADSVAKADRVWMFAGAPATNPVVYHRVRFLVGDPTVVIEWGGDGGRKERWFMVRDIELERARRLARADRVYCPADWAPSGGLSGDRETATAQAAAELLRRHGVRHVIVDRSLPMIYAHHLQEAGITVACDLELGVVDRRAKDEQEIAWLEQAQHVTEEAVLLACRTIARATASRSGVLMHEGQELTSERIKAMLDVFLMQRGYENPESIVAGGPQGADCHDHGHGPLRTGEPIIIDVFPRCRATRYWGDCTRTVVHGEIPDAVEQMHRTVVAAKQAAVAAVRAGQTGEAVHQATVAVIQRAGYQMGLPPAGAADDYCAMTHGTGHGVGLEVHEPPLLDRGGPPLLAGDCVTIEPGLYCRRWGGVRVEDMVIVTPDGCRNLNRLPEGLDWRDA